MIAFVHEHWLTLLSGVIGLFFIADCIRIELQARRNMAEQTALRVRLIAEAKEREDAYLDLYREVEQRCSARAWNGSGPEDDCLVRVVWDSDGKAEWIHFTFHPADGEFCGEDMSFEGHGDEYRCESSSLRIFNDEDNPYERGRGWVSDDGFTFTHYAALPEVSP